MVLQFDGLDREIPDDKGLVFECPQVQAVKPAAIEVALGQQVAAAGVHVDGDGQLFEHAKRVVAHVVRVGVAQQDGAIAVGLGQVRSQGRAAALHAAEAAVDHDAGRLRPQHKAVAPAAAAQTLEVQSHDSPCGILHRAAFLVKPHVHISDDSGRQRNIMSTGVARYPQPIP